MWLLSVVGGHHTNVLISLGPASEGWIPCSGAGNNHSWLLGCGGVTRSAVTMGVTGQPWQGALPCSGEQVAFANLEDWQLQRVEMKTFLTAFASKNRNTPAF